MQTILSVAARAKKEGSKDGLTRVTAGKGAGGGIVKSWGSDARIGGSVGGEGRRAGHDAKRKVEEDDGWDQDGRRVACRRGRRGIVK